MRSCPHVAKFHPIGANDTFHTCNDGTDAKGTETGGDENERGNEGVECGGAWRAAASELGGEGMVENGTDGEDEVHVEYSEDVWREYSTSGSGSQCAIPQRRERDDGRLREGIRQSVRNSSAPREGGWAATGGAQRPISLG